MFSNYKMHENNYKKLCYKYNNNFITIIVNTYCDILYKIHSHWKYYYYIIDYFKTNNNYFNEDSCLIKWVLLNTK